MNTAEISPMKVSDLTFDLKNPRLPEFDLTDNATETEVIKVLWEAMDVREVVMSIAASGFFSSRAPDRRTGGREERRY